MRTTISGYTSATQITLADNATATLSAESVTLYYGPDHSAAVNAFLVDGYIDAYIPAGVYLFTDPIWVKQYTRLRFHPDAIIVNAGLGLWRNVEYRDADDGVGPTGYDGNGNIIVDGGQWVEHSKWAIMHASHVLLQNMTLSHISGHFIEINSSKHCTIRRCQFTDQNDPGVATDREAINIDFAFAGGLPNAGSYDDTQVEDLLIEDCYFQNVQVAAGTHASIAAGSAHRNIRIINNVAEDIGDYAFHGRGWYGSLVQGNKVLRAGKDGVKMQECYDALVCNNDIREVNGQDGGYPGVRFQDGARCFARTNLIDNTGATYDYEFPYWVQSGEGHNVNTDLAIPGSDGRLVDSDATDVTIDDYTYVTLADDEALAIPVRTFGR